MSAYSIVSKLVTDDKLRIPPSRMIKFNFAGLTTPSQVIHIITFKINDVIIRRRFSVFVPQLGVSWRRLHVEQKMTLK